MREAFRPIAGTYRSHQRVFHWAGLGFVIGIVVVCSLGTLHSDTTIAFSFSMICLLVGVGSLVTGPPLICPGCHNGLESRPEHYCPECGGSPVQPATWCQPAECTVCGKVVRYYKGGRRFKLRACTHCGVVVDEKDFEILHMRRNAGESHQGQAANVLRPGKAELPR